MACHQEASSSNSSNTDLTRRTCKHDIFLSFRGDIRKGFIDHLYHALNKSGFRVFRDDKELERGEVISKELLQAIEDSHFAIVVLSKNYASSSWCLNELQHILYCRDTLCQQVFPIFYDVDPSHVRHPTENFAEAFAKHQARQRDNKVMESWKASLTEVAALSGWDCKDRNEAELIETVIEELWTKLRDRFPPDSEDLIGIDYRVQQLEPLLEIGLNDVRFVGIWGLPGVGKTTIARAIFDKYHSQFEINCFLHNVRATSEREGEVQLQSKLLSHLNHRNREIKDTHDGKKIMQNCFRNKKVLLILDDVSHTNHFEILANSPNWFGAGSRVIITTRDSDLLRRVHKVYKHEVKTMNSSESLQLFCQKAFGRGEPQEDLLELSKSVCDYAKGLPLALSVLGSHFCGRSVSEWEDTLNKLKEDPPRDIISSLEISFYALTDTEKTIFLDIACFFIGWRTNIIIQILECCGFNNAKAGINDLQRKSLLEDYADDCLVMHDLLVQMGRNIVAKSSTDVGHHTRLWSGKDIDTVMKNNLGTKEIQSMVSSTPCEACWDPEAFSTLHNLRLLMVSSSDFNLARGLQCLSHALKVLHWTKYPLDTLPPSTRLDELVGLRMHHSKLKKLWNKSLCSRNLKFLDLSYSKNLIETPDFSEFPNLERLELEGCEALVDLHASIGQLQRVQVLNLKGCKNLRARFLTKMEMSALKEFVLCGCIQVKYLPEFGESMKNLEMLDAGETNLEKLPESLELLSGLKTLKLRGCKNLICLPESIHKLKRLVLVDIAGCPKLSRLPEKLNEMEALEEIDASETDIIGVPSSIASIDQAETWMRRIETLSVTIPGSEIPSWFENQSAICLDDKGDASMITEIPPCGEEILGIALCFVLDDKFRSTKPSKKLSGSSQSTFHFAASTHLHGLGSKIPGRGHGSLKEIKSSHLRIMLWKNSQPPRFTVDHGKMDAKVSIKCGWHAIRRGDCDNSAISMSQSLSPTLSFRGHQRSTTKYDIFLSFRGEDTRRGFTSHLYQALTRNLFRVFKDDEKLRTGEVISQELLLAIKESRFAIVILSKNYASSSWCLDELQHILASSDKPGQSVFPIFYDVEPSDVRKQEKSFGAAFTELKQKFQHDQPKVQEWEVSLTKVAGLSGFHVKNYPTEAELIKDVVSKLWGEINSQLPPDSAIDELVGNEWTVDEMVSVLGIGLDDVRFIGIWGMGGVGKTTLARELYESCKHLFDFHYFLANVREVYERYGLVPLQNQLLSNLEIKHIQIEDEHRGKNTLGYIFRNRKVMLVLDYVNCIDQLENLAANREWFGGGSRIIITTRDAQLLASHGVDKIYEVKPMNHDESLQLFCQKAFRGDRPDKSLLELAKSIIKYADGLPLALCVLGSYFSGKKEIEWEEALGMLKKDLNNGIFKILKLSFDALNHVEETIFLDIACFFNMWGKDEVKQILESCGLEATIGMKSLIDKSLLVEIEIGNSKYIEMHGLVQELGWLIVNNKSFHDVGSRSRLWISDDIDQVLNENLGTRAIEGVVLPFRFAKDKAYWKPESFLSMCLLRLLIIPCNFNLPLGLKGFPSTLKVFHWYGYPCEALPSTQQMSQLVYLKMQNSKIKRLSTDTQRLMTMKILDMCHSKNLLESPNFFKFPNLRRLALEGCTSLVEIHSSLGQLRHLVEVNLKGCSNLKFLPKKLEMNSLEEFVLCGCIQVRNLPEFGEEMKKLRTLDVKGTSISKLPESLGSLTSIETLDLKGCQNLDGLPYNIHKLKCLKVLDISGCSTFSELPENLNENEALEKLDASGTAIEKVPSSICSLKQLKKLAFQECKRPTSNSSIWSLPWDLMFQKHTFPKGLALHASIFKIESLKELDLSCCNIVDGIIPNDLSGLSSLQKLDLSGNVFVNLPDGCISNLLNLQYLYLNSCPKLQFLPQPSPGLHLMDAGECGSLRTLTDKTMLHVFASIEQNGQHDEGLRRITNFSVTIPGSEIPAWFENHNHLPLNEKHVASVTIDVPEGEWLGIGLCTVIDDKICCPRWGFEFKASDGKYVSLPGRTREHEKEIKSSHLWIMFWKIQEENREELSRNHSQIRLKFCADWEKPPSTSVVVKSIKCGWHFIRKGDLELLKDGENTFSSEEHRQCNLLQGETSRTIIRECETINLLRR